MDKKVFKTLEFDKVLIKVADETDNPEVKERILSLCPAEKIEDAQKALDETSEAVGVLLRRGNPQNLKITDVSAAVDRAAMGGAMFIRELIAARDLAVVCDGIKKYALSDKALSQGRVLSLVMRIDEIRDVKKRIDDVIISEDEISDSASVELSSIRRKIKNQGEKIREKLNSIISSAKYQKALQEPIITMRGDRYVVPVKAENKNDISGIVHDTSQSGATLFVEPSAVVELSNALSELYRSEKEEIERIILELSSFVAEFKDVIKQNIYLIFELDFIFSKAKYSIKQNALAPKLNDRGFVKIDGGRHPLIDKDKVVPIDIYLGGEFDTLIITGPNTGGKTVSLKTLGLFTLMALSGLHISAKETSEISYFEDVFADIGDEQSIEQSLSTFSAHLVNLVGILKKVNEKSLVLADELGAGTDPTEGAALAISIIEYCRQKGAHFAATTHYSELKLYALSEDGVENASCEFDIKTLSPTYRLLIGVPGKSNAFAISKRLGLPDEIIKMASEHLEEDSVKLEDVLVRLEENRQKSERKTKQAETFARDAKQAMKTAKAEMSEAEQKKRKIIEEARIEALRIIEKAKEESQKFMRELRDIKDAANVAEALLNAQKAREALNKETEKIAKKTENIQKKNSKPPKNLKIGENVKILSLDSEGSVLSLPDANGNLQVQAGIMKIKVNISDLRRVKIESAEETFKGKKAFTASINKTKNAKTEIDVRGMTLDEAISEVDKFIDDSIMASLSTVTIIHGKGTGVLRSGIAQYLRKHRNVESFRAGKYGEGEHGVTVLVLK